MELIILSIINVFLNSSNFSRTLGYEVFDLFFRHRNYETGLIPEDPQGTELPENFALGEEIDTDAVTVARILTNLRR